MADRVVPIKTESAGLGGTQTDGPYYVPASVNEDGLEARSFFLQNDTSRDSAVHITRDASNNLVFRDSVVGVDKTLTSLIPPTTASQIANVAAGNLVATNVQSALNELQGDIDTINAAPEVTNIFGVTRTMPITVDGTVDIGSWALTNGAAALRIAVAVDAGGVSCSKTYDIPIKYGGTAAVFQIVRPTATSGAYDGTQDFALEVNSSGGTTTLRLRRTLGTLPATARVTIIFTGIKTNVFTASTATGTSAVTATYAPTESFVLRTGDSMSGTLTSTVSGNAFVMQNGSHIVLDAASPSRSLQSSGGSLFLNNMTFISGYGIQAPSLTASSATAVTIRGEMADSTSAVGVILDNTASLTIAGSKLVSVRNANVEKSFFNKDGNLNDDVQSGQRTDHGAYADFNANPAGWGWSYVGGTTNSPHNGPQGGYRARIGLGFGYNQTLGNANGYALEMLVPRLNQANAGSGEYSEGMPYMFTRQMEAGAWSAWNKIAAGAADVAPWAGITGKPTTLSGYGITDAVLKTGDTMSGALTVAPTTNVIPLTVNAATGQSADLQHWRVAGVNKALIYADGSFGTNGGKIYADRYETWNSATISLLGSPNGALAGAVGAKIGSLGAFTQADGKAVQIIANNAEVAFFGRYGDLNAVGVVSTKTLNTDADLTVQSLDLGGSIIKNDLGVRTFKTAQIKPTINTGVSNTTTTLNVLEIDTINTAVTGVTTNLFKASYGGVERVRVSSGGDLRVTSAIDTLAATAFTIGAATSTSLALGRSGADTSIIGSTLDLTAPNINVASGSTVGTNVNIGTSSTAGDVQISIGQTTNNNSNAYIDIINNQYTDFATRWIRSPGLNGTTSLAHRGTGAMEFYNQEAANFNWYTSAAERMRLATDGNLVLWSGSYIAYDGLANTQSILFQMGWENAVPRWKWGMESDSNFALWSYDTTGAFLGSRINVTNAGGVVTIPASLRTPTIDGNSGALSIGGGSPTTSVQIGNISSVTELVGASSGVVRWVHGTGNQMWVSGVDATESKITLRNQNGGTEAASLNIGHHGSGAPAFTLFHAAGANGYTLESHRGTGAMQWAAQDNAQMEWFGGVGAAPTNYDYLRMYLNTSKLGIDAGQPSTSVATTRNALGIEFNYRYWSTSDQRAAGYAIMCEPTSAAAGVGDLVFRTAGTSGTERARLTTAGVFKANTFESLNTATEVRLGTGTSLGVEINRAGQMCNISGNTKILGELQGNKMSRSAFTATNTPQTSTNATIGTYNTLLSTSYVQDVANQRIVVMVTGSCYASAASTKLAFRCTYGGVAKTVYNFYFNNGSVHHTFAFQWAFTGASTAGTYTVNCDWTALLPNPGGQGNFDPNDSLAMTVL